jgi:hypothetical protein
LWKTLNKQRDEEKNELGLDSNAMVVMLTLEEILLAVKSRENEA